MIATALDFSIILKGLPQMQDVEGTHTLRIMRRSMMSILENKQMQNSNRIRAPALVRVEKRSW
jgi:hypothetical protein